MSSITNTQTDSRFVDIMESYSGLPTWVKLWMNFILGPVNLATLVFLDEPNGLLIAGLSIGGMVLTVAIVIATRGFNKVAAVGHILPWTPLVFILGSTTGGSDVYQVFLTVLLITNLISLAFDYNDLRLSLKSRA